MQTVDYVLLTTCDARGERLNDLTRLLNSVDAEISTHGLYIRHYLLLQNVQALPEELNGYMHDRRTFIIVPHRLSLSRARNQMLRQAIQEGVLKSATLCAFPDDDAWYPPGSLALIFKTRQEHPHIGVFTCDYGSGAVLSDELNNTRFHSVKGCGQFIRKVSSNTIFLRADLAASVGFFDERLGVGGPINGGEDLDFALRAFRKAGNRAMIYDGLLVGHRDRMKWVRSHYFAGSLFAIARNARGSFCIGLQLLRKILIGAYLVMTRELTLGHYFQGLADGLSGLFSAQAKVAPFE